MHEWLNQLRAAPADDILCRTRLQFVTIAAQGLKICQEPTKITTKYRYRDATRFDEMDENDKPEASHQQRSSDKGNVNPNHTAEQGQLAINSLLQRASAAFDDQTVQMQQSTVDFLSKAFPKPVDGDAHESRLTADSTEQECLAHVSAGMFTATAVRKTHASMLLKPSADDDPIRQSESQPHQRKPRKARKPRNLRESSRSLEEPENATLAPEFFVWSIQQLQTIAVFEKYCKAIAAWRAMPNKHIENLPPPPHMLIHGGPGSGKSAVTRKLTRLADEYGLCSISSAMTAVAALCMENATTNHSAYHIGVDRRKRSKASKPRNVNLPNLSDGSPLRIFTSKFKKALEDGTPVVTFVDEVSLMTAITLGHMLKRYREIPDLIVGPFILVGDFYQVLPHSHWPILCFCHCVYPMDAICPQRFRILCIIQTADINSFNADPPGGRHHHLQDDDDVRSYRP
jgi:hypothetical protein